MHNLEKPRLVENQNLHRLAQWKPKQYKTDHDVSHNFNSHLESQGFVHPMIEPGLIENRKERNEISHNFENSAAKNSMDIRKMNANNLLISSKGQKDVELALLNNGENNEWEDEYRYLSYMSSNFKQNRNEEKTTSLTTPTDSEIITSTAAQEELTGDAIEDSTQNLVSETEPTDENETSPSTVKGKPPRDTPPDETTSESKANIMPEKLFYACFLLLPFIHIM